MRDAFICHTSADKADLVQPLAEELRLRGVDIWYDEFEFKVGDSLLERIDEGIRDARFGIVVLSHTFFKSGWSRRELDGLTVRHTAQGRDFILPIWHGVDQAEVMALSN